MEVDLGGVNPWAVVQTQLNPLAICQIVPRDKPTRQTAIESERKGFFLTVSRAISFGLQAMKKHALNPPRSSTRLLRRTKCERRMWIGRRERGSSFGFDNINPCCE